VKWRNKKPPSPDLQSTVSHFAIQYTRTESSGSALLRQCSDYGFQRRKFSLLGSRILPIPKPQSLTIRFPSCTSSSCPDLYCLELSQYLTSRALNNWLLQLFPIGASTGALSNNWLIDPSQNQSYLTTESQSASLSWCQTTIKALDQFFFLHEIFLR
jgi:hypothetical protein